MSINNFTFHDHTTIASVGNELHLTNNIQTVDVEIVATGTFTANFEGKGLSGAWYPIVGADLSTLNLASNTNVTTALWQIDLTALVSFRINLVQNAGTVSVYGKVVG